MKRECGLGEGSGHHMSSGHSRPGPPRHGLPTTTLSLTNWNNPIPFLRAPLDPCVWQRKDCSWEAAFSALVTPPTRLSPSSKTAKSPITGGLEGSVYTP
jgi:hypothetical protein